MREKSLCPQTSSSFSKLLWTVNDFLSSQRNIKRRGWMRNCNCNTIQFIHRPTPTKAVGNKTPKDPRKSPRPFLQSDSACIPESSASEGKIIHNKLSSALAYYKTCTSLSSYSRLFPVHNECLYSVYLLIYQANRNPIMEIKLNRGLKFVCKMKFSNISRQHWTPIFRHVTPYC